MPAATDKIDLFKLHKAEYAAKATPALVKTSRAVYLAIDGAGAPGGPAFETALGAMYAMAYGLKFASKANGQDFGVCKLEALWRTDDGTPCPPKNPDDWRWTLLIRLPDFIKAADLTATRKALKDKGKTEPVDDVRLERLSEGLCVQPFTSARTTPAARPSTPCTPSPAPKGMSPTASTMRCTSPTRAGWNRRS